MSEHITTKPDKDHSNSLFAWLGIQEMLVNEYFMFFDNELKVVNYSKNCVSFSKNILRENIAKGKHLQQLLANVDEDLSKIALKDFLAKNIRKEALNFRFKIGQEVLSFQLKKVFSNQKLIGYGGLFFNQDLKEEIGEVFENMHLMANLSWFTSHKLRGPLTSIISILNEHSFSELADHTTIKDLLDQMSHQATHLDQALFTLTTLLTNKEKLSPVVPKLSELNIKKILMLDDDMIPHHFTKQIIAKINPDVTLYSFTDGREALEFIKTFPVDLILLDLNMPILNGWEFLEALTQKNIQIPTLVVTSSIDVADMNRSFEYIQVKGFINKPITAKELDKILSRPNKA